MDAFNALRHNVLVGILVLISASVYINGKAPRRRCQPGQSGHLAFESIGALCAFGVLPQKQRHALYERNRIVIASTRSRSHLASVSEQPESIRRIFQ